MNKIIGKVSATENKPTTNDMFIFWLDDNVEVRPFDIIKAENKIAGKTSKTYGLVQDLYHITDSSGHLSNYVSSDFGDLDADEPLTMRLGVTYAVAQVIRNNKDIYMPLKNGVKVEFADEDEIKEALGLDKIKNPIPAGFIEGTNNVSVPIHLNKAFLIGPEGAHLNISGISGLATKTSYAMFILQAIQQKVDDTAFVILNVKGDDLLRLDEENPNLTEHQRKVWEKTELECKPFENVKYYYPYKNTKDTSYANSSLGKLQLKNQFDSGIAKNFVYTYEHDKANLDLLFSNVDDPNFTIESILNFINDHTDFSNLTWDEFKNKLSQYTKSGATGKDKNIPVLSWRKFKRLITKSVNNKIFQSSISGDRDKNQCHISDEVRSIKKGEVIVIDIAKLDEHLQCLVFGDILKSINELKFGDTERDEEEIPKNIVIFVDELNKYAPRVAPKNSPILHYLLEITERGRSEGITLFSAQQFRSAVHDRVKGNCSTDVFGRTNAIEISEPDYKYLPKVFSNMMTRLQKGELIINHSIFGSPLKISFPFPSYFQRSSDE